MADQRWSTQKRRNFKASLAVFPERIALIIGGIVALAFGAFILIYSTGGIAWLGGGERTAAERAALLTSGECVLRNGEPLGRIIGVLTPSRGYPKHRYQLEVLDQKKVMQVLVDEVEVVSCSTLADVR